MKFIQRDYCTEAPAYSQMYEEEIESKQIHYYSPEIMINRH